MSGVYRREMPNVHGGAKKAARRRVRRKIVAGVKLEIHDDPHKGGGHGEGDGTWNFSLAEIILNLLMFFVMMFAISCVDKDTLAAVQPAMVSDDTKATTADETRMQAGAGGARGLSLNSESEKAEATLKRAKELLERIDVSKLRTRPGLVKDFATLRGKLANLERLVGAEVMPDQDDEAFQILIGHDRVFALDGSVSAEGRSNLARLARELAAFGKPMRVSVLVPSQESAPGKGAFADPWEETSRRAARVASTLRASGLPRSHVLSSGGLATPAESDAIVAWSGGVIVHVSLVREKPFIHRGKDSVK